MEIQSTTDISITYSCFSLGLHNAQTYKKYQEIECKLDHTWYYLSSSLFAKKVPILIESMIAVWDGFVATRDLCRTGCWQRGLLSG